MTFGQYNITFSQEDAGWQIENCRSVYGAHAHLAESDSAVPADVD